MLIVSRRAWKRTWPHAAPTPARPGRAEERHRGARLELGVVVDEQDPLARRGLEPGHDAAREAEVAALGEHPRAPRPRTPRRSAVVDDQELGVERGERRPQRREAGVEQRPAPLRDHDGGDERHAR